MPKIPMDPLERFHRSYTVDESTGCWVWRLTQVRGYGYFREGSKQTDPKCIAHRWIYKKTVGQIPEGWEVDHLCRNPSCVNPEHLEAVTPKENMRRVRQTICKNGHDLTDPVNMRFDELNRRRGCKRCHKEHALLRYHANKSSKTEALT